MGRKRTIRWRLAKVWSELRCGAVHGLAALLGVGRIWIIGAGRHAQEELEDWVEDHPDDYARIRREARESWFADMAARGFGHEAAECIARLTARGMRLDEAEGLISDAANAVLEGHGVSVVWAGGKGEPVRTQLVGPDGFTPVKVCSVEG